MMFNKNEKPPVRILVNEQELWELAHIYMAIRPKTVLEIGSFCGGTLWYWMKYSSGSDIVAIDIPIDDLGQRDEQMKGWLLWNEWAEAVPTVTSFTHLEESSSNSNVIEYVKDHINPIDFIFIDGDHSYKGVMSDYEIYRPMLSSIGIMAFHDVNTPERDGIEVARAWKEIQLREDKTFAIGNEYKIENGVGRGIGVIVG